jgi:hypothetical protein
MFNSAKALNAAFMRAPAGTFASLPDSVTIDGVVVQVRKPWQKSLHPKEMEALEYKFDFVLPFSLDETVGFIEAMNEDASHQITGCDYSMEDISYDHVPEVNYGKGFIAMRVTGFVSSPEDLHEAVAEETDDFFFESLQELVKKIVHGAPLTVTVSIGGAHNQHVFNVNSGTLGLFRQYAEGHGANKDDVLLHGAVAVFVCKYSDGSTDSPIYPLLLEDIKGAEKIGADSWNVRTEHHDLILSFKD